MTTQFKQRLLLGTIGVIAVFLCIYYSFTPLFKPLLALLHAGVICIALLEYYRLVGYKGFNPLTTLGIGSSACYILALDLSWQYHCCQGLPSLLLLLAFILCFLAFFNHRNAPLGNLAVTIFGAVYLTIPLGCVVMINYFFFPENAQDGRLWLAYVLIVSKMTDIGAYCFGKSLGKTKLAPSISPKKTIEGAIGGLVTALVASFMFAVFAKSGNAFTLSLVQSLWLGFLLSVLAQLGDLTESLLKRDAGVKDSSRLPGFGGVLDVCDSLVFTLPLIYLFLYMHIVG